MFGKFQIWWFDSDNQKTICSENVYDTAQEAPVRARSLIMVCQPSWGYNPQADECFIIMEISPALTL